MIAVCGIPGAGKSTLAEGLARHFRRPLVRFDDYEILTRWPPSEVRAWLDRGAPLDAGMAPGFIEAADRAGPEAVLDVPFGRAWPGLEERITWAVWLDCPLDIALSRKLAALAAAGQGDPAFAGWMLGWLDAYSTVSRDAIKKLCKTIPQISDCLIDVGVADADNVRGLAMRRFNQSTETEEKQG